MTLICAFLNGVCKKICLFSKETLDKPFFLCYNVLAKQKKGRFFMTRDELKRKILSIVRGATIEADELPY